MEIIINLNETKNKINLEQNTILFGKNSSYKNKLLTTLYNGLTGKEKNILIDGKKPDTKDYNVIFIDEESDFENEFKFTKNNIFKQLIYDDIIDKINEEKLISYTNEIFDVIDNKVNKLLDKKINKKNDNNISFQIEIPNINSIIDKFTNIYIDNILLNSKEITKSMKRKLLYQLYFLDIKSKSNINNIIIINNFDAYLNVNEIINFLSTIDNLTNDNCHFILTSSTNIFEYINLNKFNVYKTTNKLLSLNLLNNSIKNYIIKKEYSSNNITTTYDEFYYQNESLISEEEISKIYNNLLNKYPHLISKILNCESIKILLSKPQRITSEYIICNTPEEQQLFLEIGELQK